MIKKTAIGVLAFVCFHTFSFAQNRENDHYSKRKNAATFTAVLFPYDVGFQPGFQFHLAERVSVLTEVGMGGSNKKRDQYDKRQYFKLSSEAKYYSKHVSGRYFSCQLGYIQRKFQSSDSGWFFKDTVTGYSSASVRSPVFFTAIKWGKEMVAGKHFFVDIFFGLGARYVHTTYTVKDPYPTSIGGPRDNIFELFGNAWEQQRPFWKPNASLGLRLGRRF